MILTDRVLNVEDDPMIALLVSRTFSIEGVEVQTATTVEGGLAALSETDRYAGLGKYTGLVLDYNLKDKFGTDIAIEARNRGYRGPIIIISGGNLPEAVEKTKHLPNMAYLQKPVELDELVKTYKTLRDQTPKV